MGSIATQTLVNRAEVLLHDTANAHWSEAELLGFLNDGQRLIAQRVPTANVKTAEVTLVAGSAQALPSDGLLLLDVPQNKTGQFILRTDFKAAVAYNMGATPPTATAVVEEFWYNPQTPKEWWCYPPNVGNGKVVMRYSAVPADVDIKGTIIIGDEWSTALVDYVMFRALSKEKQTKDTVRADLYLASFNSSIGG